MGRSAGSTSSTSDRGLVALGRVVGAHGLAGLLRVRLFGADPGSFASARLLWLARDESGAEAAAHALVSVAAAHGGECRVALEGIGTRTAAEAARGRWLLARVQDLARAEPGEYYVHELVGCRVEDRAGAVLGSFDPKTHPERIRLEAEAIAAWVKKGAHVSPTVQSLLRRQSRAAAKSA